MTTRKTCNDGRMIAKVEEFRKKTYFFLFWEGLSKSLLLNENALQMKTR